MKLIYATFFVLLFASCEREFPPVRDEYSIEDEDLDLSNDSIYSFTDGVVVED